MENGPISRVRWGGSPTTRQIGVLPICPWRRSRSKTLATMIAAIAKRAQATPMVVGAHLAVELGTPLGRALTRCYRLLRHPRLDAQ